MLNDNQLAYLKGIFFRSLRRLTTGFRQLTYLDLNQNGFDEAQADSLARYDHQGYFFGIY